MPKGVTDAGNPAHPDRLTYLRPDGTKAIYADRDTGHRFVVDFWLAAENRLALQLAWAAGGLTSELTVRALSKAEIEATMEAYVLPTVEDLGLLPILHAPLYDLPCAACDEPTYRTDDLFFPDPPEVEHA